MVNPVTAALVSGNLRFTSLGVIKGECRPCCPGCLLTVPRSDRAVEAPPPRAPRCWVGPTAEGMTMVLVRRLVVGRLGLE